VHTDGVSALLRKAGIVIDGRSSSDWRSPSIDPIVGVVRLLLAIQILVSWLGVGVIATPSPPDRDRPSAYASSAGSDEDDADDTASCDDDDDSFDDDVILPSARSLPNAAASISAFPASAQLGAGALLSCSIFRPPRARFI
jgi:hypothetical protein